MSNILDTVVSLSEVDQKGIKIITGEGGAGKTSFHKDMPDAAGGDILYISIGNDKGFNQLKSDKRFKTLPKSINTEYVMKNGKKVGIKKRVIPQLTEVLEAYIAGGHNFKGLTVDAISTLQELIEMEIRFGSVKNLEFDDWGAIKKAMFNIYELLEEIAAQGHEVSLQTHFQVRENEDTYSGQKTMRLLPLMTEGNAVRVLKNADAFVMIQIQSDPKDSKKVHRMSIVGGHPIIPTKIRNEHNLSFDGILFKNLTYGGLLKLMQIETLDDVENIDDVELKHDTKQALKKGSKSKPSKAKDEDEIKVKKPKKQSEEEPVEETPVEDKPAKKKPTKKKPTKKKPPKKNEPVEEVEEVEVKKPKKKKPPLKSTDKPAKKKPKLETEDIPVEDEETEEKPKKPKRKPARKAKQEDVEEDKFADDEELEDDELFDIE